jgi:hypothetical protein
MGSLANLILSHLITRGLNRFREVRVQLCNTITKYTALPYLNYLTELLVVEYKVLSFNTLPLHFYYHVYKTKVNYVSNYVHSLIICILLELKAVKT